MLTEIYRRLTALLASAGFTAWAADAVPPDAAFPYVTMEIIPAASLHRLGRVTLTCTRLRHGPPPEHGR